MSKAPDAEPPPQNNPSPVLSYRGMTPQSSSYDVTYERVGDTLTITAPPFSFTNQIAWRSFVLLLCALPAVGLTMFLVIGFLQRPEGGLLCVGFAATLFVLMTVSALRRLIYIAREGRYPAIINVWPGGIEVRATGKVQSVEFALSRQDIKDVDIHPSGGLLSGFSPALMLQVISCDDTLHLAMIPWQSNAPMIEVEDNIRDVLGLPPRAA